MGVSWLRPLTSILIPYSPAWAFFFVDNSPLEPLYRGSALFTKSRCDIKAHAESSLLTLNLKWVERNLNMLVFPHQTSLFPSYDLSCFLASWAPGSDLGGFCMFPTWGPSILSQNSPRLELAPCGLPCWQPKSSTEFLVGYHLLLIHLLGKCLLRVSCGPGNMSSGEGGSGPAKLAVSPVSSQTGGACTLGWCACWELGRGCLHWGTSAQCWRMDNEWACFCTGGLDPMQCRQVPLSLFLPSIFIGSARLARAPFLSVFALKAAWAGLLEGSSQDILAVGMSSVCVSLFQWLWSTWPTLCLYLLCLQWNKGFGCCEDGVQTFPGHFLRYRAPLASPLSLSSFMCAAKEKIL